jgi:hypothetical protein
MLSAYPEKGSDPFVRNEKLGQEADPRGLTPFPDRRLALRVLLACVVAFTIAEVGRAQGVHRIVLQSDEDTLAAALGPGVPSRELQERLDTAGTEDLTFVPVLVGSFGTFTPVPPGAPPDTAVVNIPPGDGESGYFALVFSLPDDYSDASLMGAANVDYVGRVFVNGNPITPSIFSDDPDRVTEYGNATFWTDEPSFFQPGDNVILISDANTGGGPSGAAFFFVVIYLEE